MDDEFYPGIPDETESDSREYQERQCGHEMAYDRVSGRFLSYGGRTDHLRLQGNLAAELVLHRCACPDDAREAPLADRPSVVFDTLMFSENVKDQFEERGQSWSSAPTTLLTILPWRLLQIL